MKRGILSLMIALGLLFSLVTPVLADTGQPPEGECPPQFEVHSVGEHEDHDHHVGITEDLNGDGSICVRRLDNGLHVHIDNVIQ